MQEKNISTCQSAINHSSSRNCFGMNQRTWLGVIVSIGISLILASRNIYIALDDENYIAYFELIDEGFSNFNGDWWTFVLDEPLWLLYSSITGGVFGAESALRITIFISSLMFLVASGSLTRGAWLFIFFVFVIDGTLATQMYFNQMRQGFALSIFLTIIAIGFNPIWAGVVASLIHSSFLLVILCFLISLIIRKFNVSWIIAVIVAILSAYLIKRVAPDIDLGRRSDTYEFKSELTIYYYLFGIFQYGSVLLFLRKKYFYDEVQLMWLDFSFLFFVFVICMTLIHEASARLMYLENSFMMIIIGLNFDRKQVKIIALLWLLFLLAININEARKVSDIPNDTFFDRWAMILNVK